MAAVTVKQSDVKGLLEGIAGPFQITIDRGETSSPRSIELVLLGLGACTIATIQHYMDRKGMPPGGVAVNVSSELNTATNTYGNLKVSLDLSDEISEADRKVILGIAKTCRIHKTLTAPQSIDISLANDADASQEA